MLKVSDVVNEIFTITANQKSNEIWEHEFKHQLINTISQELNELQSRIAGRKAKKAGLVTYLFNTISREYEMK